MTAQEAAGGPPAACEANGALASCLDKLARWGGCTDWLH
jgi:hypothetical protein